MKKLLLAGTAIAGFAALATPAQADGLKLGVDGFIRAYGVYADSDEPAATSLREFNLRRHTEIHFTGETTLDNGLTVGAHHETYLGDDSTANDTDETYVYFAGGWGRVNIGNEDGVGYLLQVAAPSADSNVDGLRTFVQGIDADAASLWTLDMSSVLDYDMVVAANAEKISYMTPKFNGFQAGFSYAPEDSVAAVGDRTAGMESDDDANDLEDILEIAFRYDGEFNGVGVAFGAGYGHASEEASTAGSDDLETLNVGLNLTFGAFGFGAAYLTSNEASDDSDRDTYVVGASYDHGAYHFGLTYFNTEDETSATTETEIDRVTVGGTYTFGPGMSFRGTVSVGEVEETGADSHDFTQVTLGTQVNF